MPITDHDDYPSNHWSDVLKIIKEAVEETDFEPRMVNVDPAIGLIHDRIVTNIYNDDIIVCDVSSKNPNVMFELGMRLAFDKPTIIIKDELTSYSFDTGVIEHLSYPSSLRFNDIVQFKRELIARIKATYKKSKEKDYSPFLKSFGRTIKPATLEKTEISESTYILEELQMLRMEMRKMQSIQPSKKQLNSKFIDDLVLKKIYEVIDETSHKGNEINSNDLKNEIRRKLLVGGYSEFNEEILNKAINSYVNKIFADKSNLKIKK
jgi:hypothetical protein